MAKGLPEPSILTSTSSLPEARNLISDAKTVELMQSASSSSTLVSHFLSLLTNHGVCGSCLLYLQYRPPRKQLPRCSFVLTVTPAPGTGGGTG